MRPMSWRSLTPAERELGREMFGAGLDTGRIRVLALPIWLRAFVAGGSLIAWPAATLDADFAAPEVAISVQATFIHELTHVWQAQSGVCLPWAKLRAGDRASAYLYDLNGGPSFAQLNIEQQAMVVEHAFLASRGAEAPHPAERYAALRPTWRG